jgi:hypothetical protein
MIDIKELRIGNYVLSGCNELVKIEGIISKNNTGGYLLETLKPIPINEEWLLNFGFDTFYINGKLTHYRINSYFIRYDGQDFYFELGKGMIIEVIYIHQLQNLYFCICGKEIEYNEK